jgi:hypothetical protein
MIKLISVKLAANSLITLFICVLIFHSLIITGVIPFDIVWGGRLTNETEMFRFEAVSILINLMMLYVVLAKIGYGKLALSRKLVTVALWAMVILFLLNTVGNLFSENQWELIIFTPITFASGLFSLRLAIA